MSSFKRLTELKVLISFGGEAIPVARLVKPGGTYSDTFFQYYPSWLERGIDLSPLHVPMNPYVQKFSRCYDFEDLPGFIYDFLPHYSWSDTILGRYQRTRPLTLDTYRSDSTLEKLAHVGRLSIGALIFEPDLSPPKTATLDNLSLDDIMEACKNRDMEDDYSADICAQLFRATGAMSGIRHKALISMSPGDQRTYQGIHTYEYGTSPDQGLEPWIVKFPRWEDGDDGGAIEYVYGLMAHAAGLDMPEVHLFPSSVPNHAGFFAIKRFDRGPQGQRWHMHSIGTVMHNKYPEYNFDYKDLLDVTKKLCHSMDEVAKMFHICVFNVLTSNRDDHGKNFSFLMDDHGRWRASPAYDLTFCSGYMGKHSCYVLKSSSPNIAKLRELAAECGLDKNVAEDIIERTRAAVSRWPDLASTHGVQDRTIEYIGAKLADLCAGKRLKTTNESGNTWDLNFHRSHEKDE